MDPVREIAALTAHRGRAAGTDAERRAAVHLRSRLEAMGRQAELQTVEVRPRFGLTHAIHATAAIVGSVVAVTSPTVGGAIVLLAALSTFLDVTGAAHLARRLTGRRISQNVESREDGGKPGVLVLVAHYDAPRHSPSFALVTRVLRDPYLVMLVSMVVLLACCVLRVAGLEGTVLTAAQFVPTVLLILLTPPLVDVELTGIAPGTVDNAAGVATVLRLADDLGGQLEHFDVWVLLTGAQKPFALGMRGWLRKRRGELDRQRTVVFDVDAIGSGPVRYSRREGAIIPLRSHGQLLRICREIAEDASGEQDAPAPYVSRRPTDAAAAIARGLPALSVTCPGQTLHPDALDRAHAFCRELAERLDAEVGPLLADARTEARSAA